MSSTKSCQPSGPLRAVRSAHGTAAVEIAWPSVVSTSPYETEAPSIGNGSGTPVAARDDLERDLLGGVWVAGIPAAASSGTTVGEGPAAARDERGEIEASAKGRMRRAWKRLARSAPSHGSCAIASSEALWLGRVLRKVSFAGRKSLSASDTRAR